jgi:hypothetical protein
LQPPPWNGSKTELLPFTFLKRIVTLFGNEIPIVLIVPWGFLLNQKMKSTRWRWIRDNFEFPSILINPLDAFSGVAYQSYTLFFNCGLTQNFWPNI